MKLRDFDQNIGCDRLERTLALESGCSESCPPPIPHRMILDKSFVSESWFPDVSKEVTNSLKVSP